MYVSHGCGSTHLFHVKVCLGVLSLHARHKIQQINRNHPTGL